MWLLNMFCFAHSMEVVRIHSIANNRKMKVTVYRQRKMENLNELSITGSNRSTVTLYHAALIRSVWMLWWCWKELTLLPKILWIRTCINLSFYQDGEDEMGTGILLNECNRETNYSYLHHHDLFCCAREQTPKSSQILSMCDHINYL